MKKIYPRKWLNLFSGALLTACASTATLPERQDVDTGPIWATQCEAWSDDWDKPGPPFRIYGHSYYVGTCGISAILITSDSGHILIDGASRGGGPLIAANVEALGFVMSDELSLRRSQPRFSPTVKYLIMIHRPACTTRSRPLTCPVPSTTAKQ
jgi:metallo-beta-lactamase class B